MRHISALVIAVVALAGCDSTQVIGGTCPDGLVRDVDRCVPSDVVTGEARPGCIDNDAVNFSLDHTVDDGTCEYEVTFRVDMSDAGLSADDVVQLRGTFNDFDPTATPMVDDDGDDIWTVAVPLRPGTYEYKYSINDVSAGGTDERVPVECDFTPGDASANRGFVLDKAPQMLALHRFDECVGGPGGYPAITFDDPAVTYTLTGFAGAEDSTVVDDPTGGNNTLARVVKSATAALFAGTTVSTGPNLSIPAIPFSAGRTEMTVRVLSPDAGIQVRLKVEDSTNPALSVETEATTTAAGAFETLTFDFASEVGGTAPIDFANTYDKLTIFFNFGVDGMTVGEKIYLFDDIAFP